MRKRFKFATSTILAIILISNALSLTINATASEQYDYYTETLLTNANNTPNDTVDATVTEAQLAYETISSSVLTANNGNTLLAEYYGGAYVDGDTVIVYTTGDCLSLTEQFKQITGYNNIEVLTADYSYNQLYSLKKHITNRICELRKSDAPLDASVQTLLDSFCGVGIDEKNNSVFVDLTDSDNNQIQTFKQYISNSGDIIFNDQATKITATSATTWYSGEAIHIFDDDDRTWTTCSTGFRAKRLSSNGSYQYGFVTAGHACSTGDQVFFMQSVIDEALIGIVVHSKVNSTVDAAFVALYEGVAEMTNKAYYSNSSGSAVNKDQIATDVYFTSVAVGRTLVKNGSTTYRTTGNVQSNSYDASIDYGSNGTITVSDCIKAGYDSDAGDSGGIVYSLYADGDTNYLVVGIHIAASNHFLGIGDHSIVMKITTILDELSISLY